MFRTKRVSILGHANTPMHDYFYPSKSREQLDYQGGYGNFKRELYSFIEKTTYTMTLFKFKLLSALSMNMIL